MHHVFKSYLYSIYLNIVYPVYCLCYLATWKQLRYYAYSTTVKVFSLYRNCAAEVWSLQPCSVK